MLREHPLELADALLARLAALGVVVVLRLAAAPVDPEVRQREPVVELPDPVEHVPDHLRRRRRRQCNVSVVSLTHKTSRECHIIDLLSNFVPS